MFNWKTERNYESIIAPLRQIENDLSGYIQDKDNEISEIEDEKKRLDDDKAVAVKEKGKSETTLTKISELLSGNGTLPPEEPEDITPDQPTPISDL